MMAHFFRGWKRKSGCATLLMTLVLILGWIRSFMIEDFIDDFPDVIRSPLTDHALSLSAMVGHMVLFTINYRTETVPAPLPSAIDAVDLLNGQAEAAITDRTVAIVELAEIVAIPYWWVVVPLILLSAYLLLSNPRKVGLPGTIIAPANF